jgi:hypothetical protein
MYRNHLAKQRFDVQEMISEKKGQPVVNISTAIKTVE